MSGMKHAERGLKMFQDHGVDMYLSLLNYFLGAISMESKDYKDALAYMENSLEFSKKHNDKYTEKQALIWIGRITGMDEKDQFALAEKRILNGMRLSKKEKEKPLYYIGHLFLGELYKKFGKNEEGSKSIKKAEQNFAEMGMEFWKEKARLMR